MGGQSDARRQIDIIQGAEVTVLSEKTWKSLKMAKPLLQPDVDQTIPD